MAADGSRFLFSVFEVFDLQFGRCNYEDEAGSISSCGCDRQPEDSLEWRTFYLILVRRLGRGVWWSSWWFFFC
jgi:hypothetical protein